MRKEEFKKWLEKAGFEKKVVSSRISNCDSIDHYEDDIDKHFTKDECAELLRRFEYTKEDQRNNVSTKHNIPIKGDEYNGTATYRAALNLYIMFRKGIPYITKKVNRSTTGVAHSWPEWDLPAEEECYMFAKADTK